ncbi:MAG: hypothetical protein J0G32_03080 [Alphaproteobacteria bacterium]|nr:hypothetical protein [Alphaproteobacteria bacterium]OJV16334.1 MAG: hypothetical protein BGO27_03710 [Alphaproteobacteria bacterium 33-17]
MYLINQRNNRRILNLSESQIEELSVWNNYALDNNIQKLPKSLRKLKIFSGDNPLDLSSLDLSVLTIENTLSNFNIKLPKTLDRLSIKIDDKVKELDFSNYNIHKLIMFDNSLFRGNSSRVVDIKLPNQLTSIKLCLNSFSLPDLSSAVIEKMVKIRIIDSVNESILSKLPKKIEFLKLSMIDGSFPDFSDFEIKLLAISFPEALSDIDIQHKLPKHLETLVLESNQANSPDLSITNLKTLILKNSALTAENLTNKFPKSLKYLQIVNDRLDYFKINGIDWFNVHILKNYNYEYYNILFDQVNYRPFHSSKLFYTTFPSLYYSNFNETPDLRNEDMICYNSHIKFSREDNLALKFSDKLQHLFLYDTTIPNLKDLKITSLTIVDCKNLNIISEDLPNTLKNLNFTYNQSEINFPNLSNNNTIKEIKLYTDDGIGIGNLIGILPKSLTKITLKSRCYYKAKEYTLQEIDDIKKSYANVSVKWQFSLSLFSKTLAFTAISFFAASYLSKLPNYCFESLKLYNFVNHAKLSYVRKAAHYAVSYALGRNWAMSDFELPAKIKNIKFIGSKLNRLFSGTKPFNDVELDPIYPKAAKPIAIASSKKFCNNFRTRVCSIREPKVYLKP